MKCRQLVHHLTAWSLMLTGALGVTSCHVHLRYPKAQTSEVVTTTEVPYWLWGLSGEHHSEVYQSCYKGKVYEIHEYATMTQGIVTLLTLGVYSPRTLKITCSAAAAEFEASRPAQTRAEKPPAYDKPSGPPEPQLRRFERK